MSKLYSIVFVVIIASTCHGIWLSALQDQLYNRREKEIDKLIEINEKIINERYNEIIETMDNLYPTEWFKPLYEILSNTTDKLNAARDSMELALSKKNVDPTKARKCRKTLGKSLNKTWENSSRSLRKCGDDKFNEKKKLFADTRTRFIEKISKRENGFEHCSDNMYGLFGSVIMGQCTNNVKRTIKMLGSKSMDILEFAEPKTKIRKYFNYCRNNSQEFKTFVQLVRDIVKKTKDCAK